LRAALERARVQPDALQNAQDCLNVKILAVVRGGHHRQLAIGNPRRSAAPLATRGVNWNGLADERNHVVEPAGGRAQCERDEPALRIHDSQRATINGFQARATHYLDERTVSNMETSMCIACCVFRSRDATRIIFCSERVVQVVQSGLDALPRAFTLGSGHMIASEKLGDKQRRIGPGRRVRMRTERGVRIARR